MAPRGKEKEEQGCRTPIDSKGKPMRLANELFKTVEKRKATAKLSHEKLTVFPEKYSTTEDRLVKQFLMLNTCAPTKEQTGGSS
jgi:hypothetical protein